MSRTAATRIGLTAVLVVGVAAIVAAVGRADDPRFDNIQSSIGPGFVDGGSDVLVKASWHYIDSRTLTHSSVRFTIPTGWALAAADPVGCTQTGITVTCAWGTIRQGDTISQSVRLTTDADLGTATVRSDLLFYEGPGNPGRVNLVPALPVSTDVISAGDPNKVGKCVGGGSVSTDAGVGGSDTSATVPNSDELCTPISISERVRQNPTEACLPGIQCVLEIVTTDSAQFPASTPIKLKIVYRGMGISNLPLIFTSAVLQTQVPACTGPGATPDPCFTDRRARQQSVTWFVNWSGLDPGWTG